MRMRTVTVDATEVHYGLRLLDRAADHVYCHNYIQVLTRPRYCGTCSVGQAHWRNSLKDASVKWTKLGCVVPTFPLGP